MQHLAILGAKRGQQIFDMTYMFAALNMPLLKYHDYNDAPNDESIDDTIDEARRQIAERAAEDVEENASDTASNTSETSNQEELTAEKINLLRTFNMREKRHNVIRRRYNIIIDLVEHDPDAILHPSIKPILKLFPTSPIQIPQLNFNMDNTGVNESLDDILEEESK